MTDPRTHVAAQPETERNPWLILLVLCAAIFMLLLDTTIVNVAQQKIKEGLNADLSQIQWILDSYILAFAVLILSFGRIGDIYGRKKMFIVGMAVFTAASGLCGISSWVAGLLGIPGATALIAARVLQGMGGALMMPQTLSLITVAFPPQKRGAAMGVWGSVVALGAVIIVVAQALTTSIVQFAASVPDIQADLPAILAPLQTWLDSFGLGQIDLAARVAAALENFDQVAAGLLVPLQAIAAASVGALGTMLIVFLLSIYMVVDRDQIMAFLFRLVPPSYAEEARLLQTSVARSFGGFLRGQALMGIVYFFVALLTSIAFGLPLIPLTSVSAGILQAIPFFGPFISWAPPVLVAMVFAPDALLPVAVIMFIGWFVVMNVMQPRIMQDAVGIHPIVVLGSVLIGSRLAGIPGAVFGIPIAAVASAFFFHFLQRSSGDRTVAGRAARRLSEREGRPVHIPREPEPGQAADIEGDVS